MPETQILHRTQPHIPRVVTDGGDKGKFVFETWGSVEVLDKDGQILPINEIMKAMPSMLNRGGVVHLGHTNRVVGRILDFWKADWVDPDEQARKIPGIQFKAELFGDYKSDLEAREGVRDGKYRMVSFGGMSWKGEHMQGTKGAAEVMKDLEGWEFALVEKGKNPLAYMTTINGVSVAKGDDDAPFSELVKDQRFNNILMSHLMEGVRYSEAILKAKEEYFGKNDENEVRKESKQVRKSDNMPEDENSTEKDELLSLEDLQKGYEALYDEVVELKGVIGELAEGMMVLSKEMVYPTDLQKYKITKGESDEEEVKTETLDPKEYGRAIAKELVAELLAKGFTKEGTPAPRSDNDGGKKIEKSDESGVTQPQLMPEEFEKSYNDMLARKLNKGLDDKDKFSYEAEKARVLNYNMPEGK